MKKRLWAIVLIALVCVFAFSACKKVPAQADNEITDSQTTDENGSYNETDDTDETDTTDKDGDSTESGVNNEQSGSTGNTDSGGHTHAYGAWTTLKKATCTADGQEERTCSCGAKETHTLKAGHTEVIDSAVAATCSSEGKTEGKHCSTCKQVLVAQKTTPKTAHSYSSYKFTASTHTLSCTMCNTGTTSAHTFKSGTTTCTDCPFFKETAPGFAAGYTTTKVTYVETEYVIYEIQPNIYVVGDLVKKTDELCRAMEAFSGLRFNTEISGGKKVLVKVSRSSGPSTYPDSEMSGGAAVGGNVTTARGDEGNGAIFLESLSLFLGKEGALPHELFHILRFRQSNHSFSTVLEEGFAAYMTLGLQLELEKQNKALAYYCNSSSQGYMNIGSMERSIYDSDIYTWFSKNAGDFQGNDAYTYGYCLMSYLKSNYGNCTAWITRLDDAGKDRPDANNPVSVAQIKQVFTEVYGANCLDNFYSWLRNNEKNILKSGGTVYDVTDMEPISIYPHFCWLYCEGTELAPFEVKYKNLCVNVEELRNYLTNYKNRNVDNLKLALSHDATIQLFDQSGMLIGQVRGKSASLAGVSYFRLVGQGELEFLEIYGYYNPSEVYTKKTLVYRSEPAARTYWRSFIQDWNIDEFDQDLLYRTDIEVIVEITSPSKVILYSVTGEETVLWDQTKVVVSGCRDFYVETYENTVFEVYVVPKK